MDPEMEPEMDKKLDQKWNQNKWNMLPMCQRVENTNTVNCRCRCRYKSCQMNKRKEYIYINIYISGGLPGAILWSRCLIMAVKCNVRPFGRSFIQKGHNFDVRILKYHNFYLMRPILWYRTNEKVPQGRQLLILWMQLHGCLWKRRGMAASLVLLEKFARWRCGTTDDHLRGSFSFVSLS